MCVELEKAITGRCIGSFISDNFDIDKKIIDFKAAKNSNNILLIHPRLKIANPQSLRLIKHQKINNKINYDL